MRGHRREFNQHRVLKEVSQYVGEYSGNGSSTYVSVGVRSTFNIYSRGAADTNSAICPVARIGLRLSRRSAIILCVTGDSSALLSGSTAAFANTVAASGVLGRVFSPLRFCEGVGNESSAFSLLLRGIRERLPWPLCVESTLRAEAAEAIRRSLLPRRAGTGVYASRSCPSPSPTCALCALGVLG